MRSIPRAHRPTGATKGPSLGSGAVVRWILEALLSSPKTKEEIYMGSNMDSDTMKVQITNLGKRELLLKMTEGGGVVKRRAESGKLQEVWMINPDRREEIERSLERTPVLYEARRARINPDRELDNAFHTIVAGRVAET